MMCRLSFMCVILFVAIKSSRQQELSYLRIEEVPYLVSIYGQSSHSEDYKICHGSKIGPRHVLTAASCEALYTETLAVIADSSHWDESAKVHGIVEIIRHEYFDDFVNDIAIVVVHPPFQLDDGTAAVIASIPDVGQDFGRTAYLIGTAESDFEGDVDLISLSMYIYYYDECNYYYAKTYTSITENQFCAARFDNYWGVCTGDAGSPLIVDGFQVGIVSNNVGGCAREFNVYTKVSDYSDWIYEHTRDHFETKSEESDTDYVGDSPDQNEGEIPPNEGDSSRPNENGSAGIEGDYFAPEDREPLNIEEAPFHVWLISNRIIEGEVDEIDTREICAGSILSSRLVLTSGSCAACFMKECQVRSGSSFWNRDGSLHRVDKIITNENLDFFFLQFSDDITILLVDPPFELDGQTERVVKLTDTDGGIQIGHNAHVTGFGANRNDILSDQLMSLTMQICDPKKCSEKYQSIIGGIFDKQFCASYEDSAADVCVGNTGSPLMFEGRQIGFVSWRNPGNCINPSVYTEIAGYRDWIDEKIEMYP